MSLVEVTLRKVDPFTGSAPPGVWILWLEPGAGSGERSFTLPPDPDVPALGGLGLEPTASYVLTIQASAMPEGLSASDFHFAEVYRDRTARVAMQTLRLRKDAAGSSPVLAA